MADITGALAHNLVACEHRILAGCTNLGRPTHSGQNQHASDDAPSDAIKM